MNRRGEPNHPYNNAITGQSLHQSMALHHRPVLKDLYRLMGIYNGPMPKDPYHRLIPKKPMNRMSISNFSVQKLPCFPTIAILLHQLCFHDFFYLAGTCCSAAFLVNNLKHMTYFAI